MTKRRQELDSSQKSIEELVSVLDQRKDEAIERTFKQVSKEFAAIFERLVPAGRGRLVIQRKTDQRAPDEDDDENEPRQAVENYTGVGISVSFNSKHDEQQRIQQLSGGQKSELCPFLLSCLFPSFLASFLSSLTNLHRSVRPRSRLRHPTMRPGSILPLRRNRRQSRRAVPNCRGGNASFNLRAARQPGGRRRRHVWAVHLHDFQAGDGAGGG